MKVNIFYKPTRFIMAVAVALVFITTPALAEDEVHTAGHKMGMKMKTDGMQMGHAMMGAAGHKGHSAISMTPELKKNLADMYAKMGACMKTETSMEDCQKQVMKDCPVSVELGYCPIMDGMVATK